MSGRMLPFSPCALLPVVHCVFTAGGLWLVYLIAVLDQKVLPLGSTYRGRSNGSLYHPYISIAGNFPPASCIFSEVMNLSAFLGFIIGILRFLQLQHITDKQLLNYVSAAVFSAACFGMTLVGNFQLFSDEPIHNLGTFMTFGLGLLFCWLQSFLTLRVDVHGEGRKVGIMRFLLSGVTTVCMVLYFSFMPLGFHTQAAQCQWALVMFFLLFICSFTIEFRFYRFDLVCRDVSRSRQTLREMLSEESRCEPDHL